MNVSQAEYSLKYSEYLRRVNDRKRREIPEDTDDFHTPTTLLTYAVNVSTEHPHHQQPYQHLRHPNGSGGVGGSSSSRRSRKKRSPEEHANDVVYVRFPVEFESEPVTAVEEANLRLLLRRASGSEHPGNRKNPENAHRCNGKNESNLTVIHLKVYQLIEPYRRIWLDGRDVEVVCGAEEGGRWLELDVTRAVESWIMGRHPNLGLEIQCDACRAAGMEVVNNDSGDSDADNSPALNVVGRVGTRREKRSKHHHFLQSARRKPRKTDCYKENQKCCRHSMEVVFKEIKGFEFIIQPKVFDAGYCRGKCPPRYNPAHHHALLQSLIWKQDKSRAPRPCCAPSKLVELEVLHVDEKDPRKLKVSTWTDMRALECACS